MALADDRLGEYGSSSRTAKSHGGLDDRAALASRTIRADLRLET
jgi:hypothetical protein